MALSKSEWRLYSGGQMLGSVADAERQLSAGYESSGGGTVGYAGGSYAYNRGQLATRQKYISEIDSVDRGSYSKNQESYNAIDAKYGVSRTSFTQQFTQKATDQLYGYNPAGIDTVKNYYTNQFGTAKGFSEKNLPGVLDKVYGEVQDAPAMGAGWMDMYHTYNKWEQEDQMWKEEMLGLQNELFPQALSQQRAQMAAGGMETGSKQWDRAQQGLEGQRVDTESRFAEKQADLQDTSIYKALESQYKEMRRNPEMRGIQKTETRYRDVQSWVDPIDKYTGAVYGRDSETGGQVLISEGYWTNVPGHYDVSSEAYDYEYTQGTKTGNLLYANEGGERPSFDEFYGDQFGLADNVANPYESTGVSNQPESDEDRRARQSASGAAME